MYDLLQKIRMSEAYHVICYGMDALKIYYFLRYWGL